MSAPSAHNTRAPELLNTGRFVTSLCRSNAVGPARGPIFVRRWLSVAGVSGIARTLLTKLTAPNH